MIEMCMHVCICFMYLWKCFIYSYKRLNCRCKQGNLSMYSYQA